MKEALIGNGPKVQIIDSPIPTPAPNQIVTKVIVSGSNPKDWKRPEYFPDSKPLNQGDDISGIVHAVGANVSEFKPGDRVAAFHEMMAPGGSYAEYAVSWDHTTFRLPAHTTFEEGAAIPLAAMTAAVGLYSRLGLPQPWLPVAADGPKIPLVIYGASSAVGSYAIQFAQRSNIHPLICIAGASAEHVKKLISPEKGDVILDYRQSSESLATAIKSATNGAPLNHAFDCVSEKGSYQTLGQALSTSTGEAKITFVLPGRTYDGIPAEIQQSVTMCGDAHGNLKDFGFVAFRSLAKGLEEGWFKAQPQEVIPGGLGGVEEGLTRLKEGKARAVKYVFRIAETEGAGKE